MRGRIANGKYASARRSSPIRYSLFAIRQTVAPPDHGITIRRHNAARDQVFQMRQHRIAGSTGQPRIEADIDRAHHGRDVGLALGEAMQDRGFARAAVPGQETDVARAFRNFRPDIEVKNGDVIEGAGWALEAIATPGHTANHLAFAWPERKINFVGDHVMGWSTSIVAPPDGSMSDYMASLDRLEARAEDLYFSGHGPEIPEGQRYVRFLARHRKAREASILHRLAKGETDIPTMVRAIYIGLDPRLTNAAGYSVLAHLEDLVVRGIVATDGDPVIGGSYRIT